MNDMIALRRLISQEVGKSYKKTLNPPTELELLKQINDGIQELCRLFVESHNDRKHDLERIHDRLREL